MRSAGSAMYVSAAARTRRAASGVRSSMTPTCTASTSAENPSTMRWTTSAMMSLTARSVHQVSGGDDQLVEAVAEIEELGQRPCAAVVQLQGEIARQALEPDVRARDRSGHGRGRVDVAADGDRRGHRRHEVAGRAQERIQAPDDARGDERRDPLPPVGEVAERSDA